MVSAKPEAEFFQILSVIYFIHSNREQSNGVPLTDSLLDSLLAELFQTTSSITCSYILAILLLPQEKG